MHIFYQGDGAVSLTFSDKGLLYKVWGRLRALNPQLKTNKTRDRLVATMQIHGAETTGSIIEPYWK